MPRPRPICVKYSSCVAMPINIIQYPNNVAATIMHKVMIVIYTRGPDV